MKQSQEAAAEAEAQGHRGFRLINQRRVIKLQLLKGIPQLLVVIGLHRVKAAVHHGRGMPITGQGLFRWIQAVGDGIAHTGVLDVFDAGCQIAHHAGLQGIHQFGRGYKNAGLDDFEFSSGGHHLDGVAFGNPSIHHSYIGKGSAVSIEGGVKDQRFQGTLRIAFGAGYPLDHRFQDLRDAGAFLGRGQDRIGAIQSDHFLDLFADALRVGAGQVDLIDDRNNFKIMFQGKVNIGQGLGLDALGGVHHQQGPFAGRQAAGYFIGKVHMAWCVDQVQQIGLTVGRRVIHADCRQLDGDAPLFFKIHLIQDLLGGHLPGGQGPGEFQDPVGQG